MCALALHSTTMCVQRSTTQYSDILAADTCHLGSRYEACGDEEALGPREERLHRRQHGPLQPRDRCGGLEGVKEGEDQT